MRDGVSGWVCRDVADMADRIAAPAVPADSCRTWVAGNFSVERMVDRYLDVYERAVSSGSLGEAPGRTDLAAFEISAPTD